MRRQSLTTLLACSTLVVVAGLTLDRGADARTVPGLEPYIGEITMFAGNFQPDGWAFCDGQLLSISSNSALFSILGTTYGGDGETTFGLPDLRGRHAVHQGQGPGLTPVFLGQKGGAEDVTLTVAEMPAHRHGVAGHDGAGNARNPKDAFPSGTYPANAAPAGALRFHSNPNVQMASDMLDMAGGGQPHENRPPYLGVSYIIALQGVYPSD